MDFITALDIVANIWTGMDASKYDGIIVKKLESSNTLDEGRSTNQTHIAITGEQMDLFPYIYSEKYMGTEYENRDETIKKFFVISAPVFLHKNNVSEWATEAELHNMNLDNQDVVKTHFCVFRSRRKGQADQIQLSLINSDGSEFVTFRKTIHAGDFLVLLKKKGRFEYDCIGVKGEKTALLLPLNNKLYTGTSTTVVQIDDLKPAQTFKKGENILFYGVPGSGKSNTIKTQYCDDDVFMERAVFHPDYTYSDFIGQILPKVSGDGKITYEFEPGPFTRILKMANDNQENNYFLVVEEINRGNAPAIFGDIFQLLDRDDNGVSEYGISNEAIAGYVYSDKTKKVKIPANLFILATMNTSDQNVFTLDTAFKRRWKMKHIENDIDACVFADHTVCGSDITWSAFAKTINKLIIEVNTENLSNEDNRLGAYFVREHELDDPSGFGEKVLMYLWNDAFKYDHEKVFRAEYHTLDELINGFRDEGMNVFVDEVDFSIVTPSGTVLVESAGRDSSIDSYLAGKKSHLVAYYNALRELVKEQVPDIRETSTPSLQYAAWRADNISKSSFADFQIQNERIVIFTEVPDAAAELTIGEEIPRDGHHNHYYKIIYNENEVNEIVGIIVESYEQLKKE